jgi:hypothetical protein
LAKQLAVPAGWPAGIAQSNSNSSSSSSSEAPSQSGEESQGGAADFAVSAVAAIAGSLTPEDRQRISAAGAGLAPAQVRALLPRILEAVSSGTVRNVGGYVAKLLREAPPAPPDHAMQVNRQRARQLCNNLGIPFADFEPEALRIVVAHPGRITPATDATWNDHRAGSFENEPREWWRRFLSHVEAGEMSVPVGG